MASHYQYSQNGNVTGTRHMDDQNQNAGGSVATPQNLTIGGAEYSPEEAERYINLGRQAHEAETKYNTKFDRVYPEFTRLTQERQTWNQKEQEYKTQLAQFQQKQQQGTDTNADLARVREAAKQAGFSFNDEIEKNYVKKDEIPTLVQQYIAQQKQVDSVLSEADNLAKEIDGKDGRPRFNKLAVLNYAEATGQTDLKKAYETMYEDELKQWGEVQAAKAKRPGLQTFGGARGNKAPANVKVTRDNLGSLLQETME